MIEEYRNGKELEEKAKEAGFTSYMDMATHVHAILPAEPLAKLYQRGRPKGARPVLLHPDEILHVWVLTDVLHQPFVAALQPPLDQQRPQCHPARVRRMPVVDELRRISVLCRVKDRDAAHELCSSVPLGRKEKQNLLISGVE